MELKKNSKSKEKLERKKELNHFQQNGGIVNAQNYQKLLLFRTDEKCI